jgi:heat shock protein HslJ
MRGPATASVWALRSLQGRRIYRSAREVVTLRLLPDHSVAGTASCNSIGGLELTWIASTYRRGTFRRDSSQPTIMTQAGCPNAAEVAMAGRFWTLMTGARAWGIDRGDLVIRFGDGTTALLKPIELAAGRLDDCRNADQNNFDCPRAGHARGAKPQ